MRMIQAADGRLHQLSGDSLPELFMFYTGTPLTGAHLAEVLMNPRKAAGVPLVPSISGWLTKRDAFYIVLGMIAFRLIMLLADESFRTLVVD